MHTGMRKALLGAGVATLAMALSTQAFAQQRRFDIPAQDAATAVTAFGLQADLQISAPTGQLRGVKTPAVQGEMDARAALQILLAGTGLVVARDDGRTIVLQMDPQGGSAAGGGVEVEALIVTAQKREESIQDVPIAISAFSQSDLEAQKMEGGPDLMRGVPNLTFSKSNFTSYNISIRGIGTKAISASTDPGVAVSFNNVGLIVNRFFEQEFFDLERLEVLRGPQGTLYGRNATGGVVNLITAKPDLNDFDGWIKGEVGNFHAKRLSAMVNVPLVEDVLAVRLAGALTDRQGYDYNSVTKNAINGRDLWSARLSVGFRPTDSIRADLIWERFEEDDNRSRTGKQLCHRDEGPAMIGSTPTRNPNPAPISAHMQEQRAALFSTGCKAGSLYDDNAFGTPNGLALGYVAGINMAQTIYAYNKEPGSPFYSERAFILDLVDPYGGMMQSRDLRQIASVRDPRYRASSDIVELNVDVDLSDTLTLTWQSAFAADKVYSFQDFNRFNTIPVFNDTTAWYEGLPGHSAARPSRWREMAPGGIFCDPQIGCSNTMAVFDISSSESKQFSQEVRLQSDFDGTFNFSFGGNYTRFKTQNDYYVMGNILTAIAMMPPFNFTGTQTECNIIQWLAPAVLESWPKSPIKNSFCPYIDPNPVESIDGEGHNYFRSSNPYKLNSYAVFGEAYYNIAPDLKLTAGLRYTHDNKRFTLVPSQLLLSPTILGGGLVGTGHPADRDVVVEGGEVTGRFGVDWKPSLSFTDETLLYAFYSRGYKAGGVNPPTPGFATTQQLIDAGVVTKEEIDLYTLLGYFRAPGLKLTAVNYGPTFEPEFVNALEIGTKNTLVDGRLTLNAGAFFYDYENYQVSQIRDRTAVNENFNAKVWGAELSALFLATDHLRINANLGYLDTRIADGEKSIDPINRNLGDPAYTVVKPWVQLPSNCVVPSHMAEVWLNSSSGIDGIWKVCGGLGGFLGALYGTPLTDPLTGAAYDPANYPELNGGAGLYTELGGNELPNSPHWTANVGGEYGVDFAGGEWRATVRGDLYWQSQSWSRVYNLGEYDKLHGWWNANLSLWIERPDDGLKFELYVKNIFDDTPITDAFLNSDDSGLTTNVFVLDPRLIGLSIRKEF